MRKLDAAMLVAILTIAAALRIWLPWNDILGGAHVHFLENDAWYHVRLAESQVRNFPHRLTTDPFAAPDGQYVAVAPLLDTTIASIAFALHGRNATSDEVERVAAMVPGVAGVLCVLAVWALATVAFDQRAGLLAALLAAILPGHFLDRTLIGFVDHHVLEVLFATATMAGLVYGSALAAGISLGLYLLSWASGAYFVFILAVWIFLAGLVAPQRRAAARLTVMATLIALAMVLVFQDPALFRYGTQIASLAGLLITALAVWHFGDRLVRTVAVVAVALSILVAGAWLLMPGLVGQVMNDIGRFRPDPTRMAVLEARPLFLYTGNWSWRQPWEFFRTGFFVGVLATATLAAATWRSRRTDYLLILTFTVANYLATLGQNRFGYYLVPATAVVIGWLSARLLEWSGAFGVDQTVRPARRRMPFQRELAVMLVAGVVVAPNIVPSIQAADRVGGMPDYWLEAVKWLEAHTPEPFSSPDYYYARMVSPMERATYTVMNWWDQGYWIIQGGHRVPVSNPTQGGAPVSAAFLTSVDESSALERLAAQRSRFVIVDWELVFRDGADGKLEGRFQSLADWAGVPTARFYSLCFTRPSESSGWQPVWIFREAYYQTMAYRLTVLGGKAAEPRGNTWVVHTRQRRDNSGGSFCEVVERTAYPTPDEAKMSAAVRGPAFEAVGLSPWQPAFNAPAVNHLQQRAEFRDPSQLPGESPMIRIFEVTPPATR